ncbi:hypothetical protein TRFO_29989 [Tritrichomonas foetus]|uniref:Uncharacterized protein n=1 Tax=Tritrichomonas foetus TaxID=1144522 RepID=A0A1J4JWH0_9EUKA|nr:hypothetical protein TRFO_29989 [Tritrichomonas foetus]|eukprot:OHT02792.1 hypothetical protein TRFO_29989 [Tritrichomonas foetus]
MASDNIELHKIHAKISKLRKVQADALTPPTFSHAVSDQFNKILDKIKSIDEQNKFAITHNRIFVEKVTQFIPEIVELSQQNFIQSAIVSLQTQLSSIYSQSVKLSEMASNVTSSRGKIVTQLKQIMSRALMISYHKVSPTVFINIQQMLAAVTNDLSKLGYGAWKDLLPQFPLLIPQINDVDSLLKHLTAAHTFIFTAQSLQNSLRRAQLRNPGIQLPLRSHQTLIEPSKPSIIPIEPTISESTNVDELLEQLKKNPEQVEEFLPKLKHALHHDFIFYSPATSIQGILAVILTIHPPNDLKSKLFMKSYRLFRDLTAAIQNLCQLPKSIYTKEEISDFETAIENFEKSVDSMSKARKKPSGWTAEKSKMMILKFEEYIIMGKNIIKAAETVEKINSAIEPHRIALDLSKFHIKPVESRFTRVTYPSHHKMHYFTIMRALNIVGTDLEELNNKGLCFRNPCLQMKEIHPISFKSAFETIQKTTEILESDIFRFSISAYNEFPVSKSGVTILSCFAELQRNLENSLLSMHVTPLTIMNLRLMSIFLFEQGFPLTADDNIDTVLKAMSSVYDAYVFFCKLERVGAASINVSAQLCFLATMCDELSEYNDVFVQYRDYFSSINLFEIDNETLLEHIASLHQDAMNVFESWSCTSIVSKFTQYTKTIYTCSTQLKRVSVEPLLTKLLAQLSSWLGNLSRTLPKPTNLREMQIRMSVLYQLFSAFLENNPEMKKQIPFDQLTEVIGLFKKLRYVFSTKTRLKQLLTYIERIQINPDDLLAAESSSTDVESTKGDQQQQESCNTPDTTMEPEEAVKFQFSSDEVNMWIPFSQSILKSSCYSKKREFPVNYLSPKLIFDHFTNLITKYCDMWRLEKSFSQEIHESFGPMLHQHVDITIPGLSKFFTSNIKRFEQFREKMTVLIEQHLEMVIKSLSEFSPIPRSRGFQRETPPPHPNAPLIAEVNKGLQMLRESITGTDFSWYPELVRLYHQLNPLLDAMSLASDGVHPCSSFRRLCRKSYLCFLCSRYFQIFSSNLIPYGPDLESLRCLISDFMENPTLANDNTEIMRHQIENIMNSDLGCDTFVFESSMKLLRRACSLINIKAIVEMIDADFFSFDEFFGNLPTNVSSLSTFLSSSLFESVEAARKALFVLVSTSYDDTIAHKCIMALQTFLSEISKASFDIDKSTVYNSITACRTIQSLSDVSSTFDCLDVFTPKSNDKSLLDGSWVLRVRILLLALESRMDTLMNLATPQFRQLFKIFRPVMNAVERIPDRFGYIDSTQASFEELRECWKYFIENFQPIDLIPQWSRCKQISQSIPSVLHGSIDHPDIRALSKYTQAYNVTHDPRYLIRMKLSFLFVEKQVKRYMPNPEFVIFPFCEMQDILTVLQKFNEVSLLIPIITERINKLNLGDSITNPKSFMLFDTVQFDTPQNLEDTLTEASRNIQTSANNNSGETGQEGMSFKDQVTVSLMIDTFIDANYLDKEKIAQLPFIEEQVKSLEPFIESTKNRNEELSAVNEYLNEPIRTMKSIIDDDGKSQTKVEEMIELNSLQAKLIVESEQFEATKKHFEALNQSSTEARKILDEHASVKRQKLIEKDAKEVDLEIEKIEATLNTVRYEELQNSEYREKLNLLTVPFNETIQSSPTMQNRKHEITQLDLKIDEIEKKANDVKEKMENVKRQTEIEKSIMDGKYSKAELIQLKEKYLKSEEKLLKYAAAIKNVFD